MCVCVCVSGSLHCKTEPGPWRRQLAGVEVRFVCSSASSSASAFIVLTAAWGPRWSLRVRTGLGSDLTLPAGLSASSFSSVPQSPLPYYGYYNKRPRLTGLLGK